MRLVAQPQGAGGLAAGAIGGVAAGAVGALAATTSRGAVAAVVVVAAGVTALVVAGSLRRVLLTALVFDVAFQWDKFLGWRPDIAKLAALGGFNVSVTTLALTGLFALWIANLALGRATFGREQLRALRAPAAFLAVYLASLAWARDRTVAGFEVWLLAQMFLLFVYLSQTTRAAGDVRFLLGTFLVVLIVESLVALASYAAGGVHIPGTSQAAAVVNQSGVGNRLVGTLGAPNTAGAFFAFGLSVAAATLTAPVGRPLRRLAKAAGLLAVVCLGLTLSRGAWIGAVVSLVVVGIGASGRRATRLSPRTLFALGAVAIVALIPLGGMLNGRIQGNDRGAAASRVPLIEIASNVIEDHPFLGVGANNLAVVLPAYTGPPYAADWINVVHNKLLLIWTETGVIGLVAFLAFVGGALRRGWRARTASDPIIGAVALGLTGAIAGHLVHLNFDTFKGRPMNELLWLAAGLLASGPFLQRTERA